MGLQQFTDEWAKLAYFSMENALEMIFWVRPDGSFYYVNPAARKKIGYSIEELALLRVPDILEDYSEEERDNLRARIEDQVRHTVRATLRCKDGRTVPVESINNAVRIGGKVINCAFVRDITRRVQAEAEMAERQKRLLEENETLRTRYELSDKLNIVGTSRRLMAVLDQAERFAANDRPVLIQGESGVGKESIANYVHLKSVRHQQTMVSINCATLQESTIVSKLFGHVKGAFTGAYRDAEGLFSQANESTLFLDEIGELSLAVQAMLLRVLQTGEYSRMGDGKVFKTNARIVAATNRDLGEMVAAGTFREDLRYRLDVLKLQIPPLRERSADLPLLIRFKLSHLNREYGLNKEMPSDEDLQRLRNYDFPGNIRELFNLLEKSYFSTDGVRLSFPINILNQQVRSKKALLSYDDHARQHILRALAQANGKISGPGGAAELLGLKRGTLSAKMRKLGIS